MDTTATQFYLALVMEYAQVKGNANVMPDTLGVNVNMHVMLILTVVVTAFAAKLDNVFVTTVLMATNVNLNVLGMEAVSVGLVNVIHVTLENIAILCALDMDLV